ncbi:hypothetical protein DB32_005008 [Sandaracinus amylolyticus]|uniref:Uncharacterized protein n=1 Tax=Sandaracinus amylolyticus TaxID=927083 RepID=A0A0F6SG06_9BACT|nr:hypothetical protein DB32_005008 [Sandaracinus amylolyticus]
MRRDPSRDRLRQRGVLCDRPGHAGVADRRRACVRRPLAVAARVAGLGREHVIHDHAARLERGHARDGLDGLQLERRLDRALALGEQRVARARPEVVRGAQLELGARARAHVDHAHRDLRVAVRAAREALRALAHEEPRTEARDRHEIVVERREPFRVERLEQHALLSGRERGRDEPRARALVTAGRAGVVLLELVARREHHRLALALDHDQRAPRCHDEPRALGARLAARIDPGRAHLALGRLAPHQPAALGRRGRDRVGRGRSRPARDEREGGGGEGEGAHGDARPICTESADPSPDSFADSWAIPNG